MDTRKTTKREPAGDVKREKVRVIPIQYFDDFPGHPFKVKMDEDMNALIESVKEFGILTPLLARKTEQERYEIIAGHRRKLAAKKAGLTELPVILREMTRDEAIIAMVDSNLHRERILPSERAFAYKMKLEARNRQGKRTDLTSTPVVSKLRTNEEIGLEGGDSREQVRRYVRLTYLSKDLLKMVDDGRIAFRPAVEISYKRIIKDNGAILLFGQGRFYVELVESNRKWFRYDIVWDKVLISGFLNANRMPLRRHEQIAVFYKKLPKYRPQFTEGQPLHGKGKAYKDKAMKNQNYGSFEPTDDVRCGSTEKYPTSVLVFPKAHPSCAEHPTEKPVALLEYLIKTYTDEGDVVMDNCMGSGSTIVACIRTNRRYIGFELNEEHFATAERRIYNEMKERR